MKNTFHTHVHVSAAFIALVFAFAAASSLGCDSMRSGMKNSKRYPEGAVINGVSIAGLSQKEAKELLSGYEEAFIAKYSCTMRCGKDEYLLTSRDIPVGSDLDELLHAAFSGGRFELSYVISAYRARLYAAELAKEINREPDDVLFEFSTARYPENERFALRPGAEGIKLDVEACAELIASGTDEFELPLAEQNTGKKTLPVLRGSFETSFHKGTLSRPERVFNIRKAAALINGTVIPAYGTVSCNEAIGDRTEVNGWRLAPGITEGGADTEDQPGGGVCQVTSTVFNAALYADMAVISRTSHSRPVAYVDPGRDATVVTGGTDLVLKNTTDEPMYLFCWADEEEGSVRCEIWGKALDADISVDTELVETIVPTEDEFELDETLGRNEWVEDNAAITGYKYVTYREKSVAGKTERETVCVSEYRMHPRRIRCGKAFYERAMNAAPAYAKTARPNLTPTPRPDP